MPGIKTPEKVMAKTTKRNLFAELNEGFDALAEARTGKRTLRTHPVEVNPVQAITAEELIEIRTERRCSRAVFARHLRVQERTLENWEQGRSKPNAQAALLIRLAKRYPDTLEKIATL